MKLKTAPKAKANKNNQKKSVYRANVHALIDFLIFLRDNYLEEFAKENLRNSQKTDIPLMKLLSHIPEKQLIEQSMKTVCDNIESLQDGTYIEKQKASLKLWEQNNLPGISKYDISPTDLVMMYAIQKKGYFKFLPLYTQDTRLAIEIMEGLEELNLASQNEALTMLFRLGRQTEAQVRRTNELLLESEERLRLLTQNIRDYAFFMLDKDGYIVTWGKGAENVLGYRTEEIIGKHISMFYIKEDIEQHKPVLSLEMVLEHGRYETEGWRLRKDKSVFWANMTYSSVYAEDGKLKGFAIVARDLTERKKMEEQLKNSNRFLDSILENLPNMVFVKDAQNLRFVRFNKAGEKLLGFSENDMVGKNDYDFFSKQQADLYTASDKAVLAGNEVVDIAAEEINTKKGKRWLHTRKISIKDSEGKPRYLVGVSEDITEKRDSEIQIRNLNLILSQNVTRLEDVNKELDSFSYSVSHDLRAPLRAIHGYAKILLDDYREKMDDDGKEMMEAVMDNAIKMGQLIDDLLAFSRMGKRELSIMPVDMTQLAASAFKTLKSYYTSPIKANISIMPLLPCSADPNLMEQVFTNLISNAIKYSSKTPRPLIEVNSYYEKDENIYYVKDNGAGFDMKYSDKLFGVFQRLHSANEFEGTGVGLALVKRIVTRHGGRVWAEAEPDKGATFYIALQKKINTYGRK